MARIGIQAMMLKKRIETEGVAAVWQRVADLGFRLVEVSQVPLTAENRDAIVRANGELGMEVAAISGGMAPTGGGGNDSLVADFDKIVADARALGTTNVRIGMMPVSALASLDALLDFCRQADDMAKRLRDEGIVLSYHNHHVEFARFDGRRLLDIIRNEASELRFEIDLHWVQRGGASPERVLRDYTGVVDLVHLKDFRIALPSAELIADRGSDAFGQYWTSNMQFAEVGEGNLDWDVLVPAAVASGAEHLLIEQDDTYGRDIYDSLKMSHDNLVNLGFGDLF